MAEFTPINTQAEFDAAIADRLARQEKSITSRFEGAMPAADVAALKSGYEKTINELKSAKEASDTQLTEALSKIKGYATDAAKTRIALEIGIPFEMAPRLNGETEDDIRKDAEALKKMFGAGKPAQPLANPEQDSGDANSTALKNLLRQMRNQ